MKTVELTLPQLQTWLFRKLRWEGGQVMSLLFSVSNYAGTSWVEVPDWQCPCGGGMFAKSDLSSYRVKILHEEHCHLAELATPALYAVFYSTEVNGIWTQWAFEDIVPFTDLHKYVAGERVKYSTHRLPEVSQETSPVSI